MIRYKELKDAVAKEYGYRDWRRGFLLMTPEKMEEILEEVAKRYAQEVGENAAISFRDNTVFYPENDFLDFPDPEQCVVLI